VETLESYYDEAMPHPRHHARETPEEIVDDDLGVPGRYRVLLHNDDYTAMDFVVEALVTVFRRDPTEAMRIMLEVHVKGTGVAGVYPRDEAETRIDRVHAMARARGYPLKCTTEPE
jgi:ATP-dependent Clp protease adaptor protein ClpS